MAGVRCLSTALSQNDGGSHMVPPLPRSSFRGMPKPEVSLKANACKGSRVALKAGARKARPRRLPHGKSRPVAPAAGRKGPAGRGGPMEKRGPVMWRSVAAAAPRTEAAPGQGAEGGPEGKGPGRPGLGGFSSAAHCCARVRETNTATALYASIRRYVVLSCRYACVVRCCVEYC